MGTQQDLVDGTVKCMTLSREGGREAESPRMGIDLPAHIVHALAPKIRSICIIGLVSHHPSPPSVNLKTRRNGERVSESRNGQGIREGREDHGQDAGVSYLGTISTGSAYVALQYIVRLAGLGDLESGWVVGRCGHSFPRYHRLQNCW